MVGQALVDQGDDFARDRVRLEAPGCGQVAGALGAEGFPVVGIEVPLPAFGLPVGGHQHAVALALLAVEVFQPQLLAAFRMGGKVAHRGEEVAVVVQFQAQSRFHDHGLQGLQDAPVARRGHDHLVRRQPRQGGAQLGREAAAVGRIIQAGVVQRPACQIQRQREVAHGGEEEGGALLAGGDVGGFLGDFGHPHRVLRRVEVVKSRSIEIELITEHDHQTAQPLVLLLMHRRCAACGRRRNSI